MRLAARLAAVQAAGRLPSVVGGVLRDGELVESAAVNGTVETQYRIGSITKTLTAVLVMQLRDEGLLDLADPVGRFLPESGYGAATIADLLAHTAGLQSEPTGSWWERSTGGDFAALAAANDGSGAVAGPGEFFHYSNLGYGLLGEVVARLRGASWWDVVQTRLLTPLAMTRTSYDAQAPHAQGSSVVHFTGELADEPHTDTGAMAPAGQLWSTVADLAGWGAVLAGRHPEIVSPTTLGEMGMAHLEPVYGLGLRRLASGDGVLVGHTGSMPGFLASLFVDPVTGDGAIVLADATTGLDTDGVPHLLLGDTEPETVAPWVPTSTLPAEVAGVVGVWFWGNTAIELRWSNDVLEARGLQSGLLQYTFGLRDGRWVGLSGYHRGEVLHVHPTHLECATFVYTRVPYAAEAPIPGR